MPRQNERHALSLTNRKLCFSSKIFAAKIDWGFEDKRIRAADCAYPAGDAANPRNDRAVVEADDQLHSHAHLSAFSGNDPNDIGRAAARRHAIN